jgi:hypothetical protein
MPSTWTVVGSRCSCDTRIAERGGICGADIDPDIDPIDCRSNEQYSTSEVPIRRDVVESGVGFGVRFYNEGVGLNAARVRLG